MTDKELICQLIMIDISHQELNCDFKNSYKETPWGGIILFAKNIKDEHQLKKLNKDLKELSLQVTPELPILIGSDHEGGIVTRFNFDSISPLCGNMALGAANNPFYTETSAQICGNDLINLGFNVNFAPVVDINSNPLNPIIGARSFGESPKLVADMAESYIKGSQKCGMLTCAKHFPGHGDVSLDSHLTMPLIEKTLEELESCEIIPFKRCIENGVDMVMTSHIAFTALEHDPSIPATLSKNILTDYLRGKLDFDGVIITDSMSMKGIRNYFGYEKAAVMAFKAGADIVMLCGNEEEKLNAVQAIAEAIQTGELDRLELEKSYKRVSKLRKKVFSKKSYELPSDTIKILKQMTAKSITVVKNESNIIPLKTNNLLLIQPEFIPPSPQGEAVISLTLESFLQQKNNKVNTITYAFKTGKIDKKELISKVNLADILIFCVYANGRMAEKQIELADKLKPYKNKLIAVSLSSPYILRDMPWVTSYINCYNHGPISMESLAEIITGEKLPFGVSPVTTI